MRVPHAHYKNCVIRLHSCIIVTEVTELYTAYRSRNLRDSSTAGTGGYELANGSHDHKA